jgi:membrane protein implicated in regulation of membrane protease activity
MAYSVLARHVTALACAALLLDVLAVVAFHFFPWSIVPGFHYRVVAPRAAPAVLGVLAVLAVVHAVVGVAVWQRFRYGKEPSSRSPA